MKTSTCPVIGEYVVTQHARSRIDPKKLKAPKDTLMTNRLNLGSQGQLVPLASMIALMKQSGEQLDLHRTHPKDAHVIGIPLEVAEQMELVLARTQRVERDLYEHDALAATAREEASAARAAIDRLRPLADRARANALYAEDLLTAFRSDIDPISVRDRYLAAGVLGVSSADEDGALCMPSSTPLPTSFGCRNTCRVTVHVDGASESDQSCSLKVVDVEPTCPVFTLGDINTRHIAVAVPDTDDFFRLRFCFGIGGISMKVDLALTLDVSKRGLSFSGAFVRFCDLPSLRETVTASLQAKTGSLFPEPGPLQKERVKPDGR